MPRVAEFHDIKTVLLFNEKIAGQRKAKKDISKKNTYENSIYSALNRYRWTLKAPIYSTPICEDRYFYTKPDRMKKTK